MTSNFQEERVHMEKTKNVPYRLHPVDHKKLKLFCVEHGIPMQQLLEKAVQEYLKKWAV